MDELPLGFAMSLAQNPAAMKHFSTMTPDQQEDVLQQTHQIRSKQEMQNFVAQLADKPTP
jgi:uncharacterized protein YdeI (YjbR/CyaY-like superfamily)